MWPSGDGYGYDYFTLFCGLAMFVIMGIGADDVFVYWDTWVASKNGEYGSTAERLSHVYGHAVNAMLVTSVTTVIRWVKRLMKRAKIGPSLTPLLVAASSPT